MENKNKKERLKNISSKNKYLKEKETLKLVTEKDIAFDFATKVYQKFDKLIKSIILFGSNVKGTSTPGSDIDIIIIVDDVSVSWDEELIVWYREELGKLIQSNPYRKELHINSIRLKTWWQDLIRGDPIVINILRYGYPLIDFGGFFTPLKVLLQEGKIKSTEESIFINLQRAPLHISRSRANKLSTIEGLYWAMIDSAQAALMAAKKLPPSPENVPLMLKETFVDKKELKINYVVWLRDLYVLHRKILHGEITDIKGREIDEWFEKTNSFVEEMKRIVKDLLV
ncbi:MAG: nucleotidyltransferase domain-containing protein [Candidatus Pacearchaeota archaeon]